MSASGRILTEVRGAVRRLFSAADEATAVSADGGELVVCQGLPLEAELSRLGLGRIVVGSAVAPVAAIPTTAAHLSLYNGNPLASLIVAAVGGIETTSAAVAGQMVVLARNDVPGQNANPLGTVLIAATNGSNYGGGANAKASVTLAAIAAPNNVVWTPTGASAVRTTTTGIGLCAHAECFGRWVIRPGGMFSLATLAQTAAGSVQPYILFYECLLNNPG